MKLPGAEVQPRGPGSRDLPAWVDVLSGPAGGTIVQGSDGPRLEMDALEFCRVLSGRAPGGGLLATKIFFCSGVRLWRRETCPLRHPRSADR